MVRRRSRLNRLQFLAEDNGELLGGALSQHFPQRHSKAFRAKNALATSAAPVRPSSYPATTFATSAGDCRTSASYPRSSVSVIRAGV